MAFFRRIFTSRIPRPEEISKHLSGLNPLIKWNLLNELGDGSFAKVLLIDCVFKDTFIFSSVIIFLYFNYCHFMIKVSLSLKKYIFSFHNYIKRQFFSTVHGRN